jgi:LytS/YehU family sensor histidine kinase
MRGWFFLILAMTIVLITITITRYRSKLQIKRITHENEIQRTISELEQKALQAQMNPHFIFNSLNSIQQYIITNNQEDANKYLTIFASMIRETLENSTMGNISLVKEIEYLSKYLELERLRFGSRFSYSIDFAKIDDINNLILPVMLLQPFVENAVRHGMRYKFDSDGLISISFEMIGYDLHCIIEDNGPGRAKTNAIRSLQHIEYQSRGMDLTKRRIDLLNKISGNKIAINIDDILDIHNNVNGTRVHIIITQINENR